MNPWNAEKQLRSLIKEGEVREGMKERDRKIAMELKRRLSASAPLLDLRVFGSRARGDSDQYSDMDVFVLVETVNKDLKQKIRDIVWEVGFENFLVISPLIFTKDEVENTPLRSSQIVRNITEEGVSI